LGCRASAQPTFQPDLAITNLIDIACNATPYSIALVRIKPTIHSEKKAETMGLAHTRRPKSDTMATTKSENNIN